MDEAELIDEFMLITASLKSGASQASNKMQEAFKILAKTLAENSSCKSIYTLNTESKLDLCADESALSNMDIESRQEMEKIITNAISSATGPFAPWDAKRIFRRTVPFLTATGPSSEPSWAKGQRIVTILGPFEDCYGRTVWFDIYRSARHVSVIRQPIVGNKNTTIILLPFLGTQLAGNSEYAIPAGSIWILSSLLASKAPKESYSGIRVTGGTMRLSSPALVADGQLIISPKSTVILELTLDLQSPGRFLPGPGGDARDSKCSLPKKVIFEFAYRGGRLKDGSGSEIQVYGNSFKFSFSKRSPRDESNGIYEPLLNRVLLPMSFASEEIGFPGIFKAQEQIKIDRPKSDLLSTRGSAKVLSCAWALPVAIAPPEYLGDAIGAGAIALVMDRGINAGWLSLAGGLIRLGRTTLLSEPGLIELVAGGASNSGASLGWQLWKDGSSMSKKSRMDLQFTSAFPLHYICRSGLEALELKGMIDARLDRPVKADRTRMRLHGENGIITLWRDLDGFQIKVVSGIKAESTDFSIALTNALFKVRSPLGIKMQASMPAPNEIRAGSLFLPMDIFMFTPMLRDPYVSNILAAEAKDGNANAMTAANEPISRLLACTKWLNGNDTCLLLQLISKYYHMDAGTIEAPATKGLAIEAHFNGETDTDHGREKPDLERAEAEDKNAEINLQDIFERGAGGKLENFFMLDVSSNVGQIGVGFGRSYGSIEVGNFKSMSSSLAIPFSIKGMDLVASEGILRIFMLPQIQWEPVINVPSKNVGYFPEKTGSMDDGGPAIIGANSATLVPIAPDRLLEQIITEFKQKKTDAASLFTLPFGIKVVALFQYKRTEANLWATLNLIEFEEPSSSLKGSLQISARANSREKGPDFESPHFLGAAYQTRNLVDMASKKVLGISVLRGDMSNEGVEPYFNNEMGPGKITSRVPVTRIDLSGYGASMFSHWFNPNVKASGVSQACFDVMVGRTAHEVVQVSCILYPWAVPVVRIVTMERKMEGFVIRKDSGWIAVGPGLYRYPSPKSGWSEIQTHPGLVAGVYNVRNIRETSKVIDNSYNPLLDQAELLEVSFDGDFEIEGAVSGMNADGLVTGLHHIGYLQRSPMEYPLSPEQYEILIDKEGPIGGPVDCLVDIGKSGQMMQVIRVDVGVAPSPAGPPHFAAVVHGSLQLPGSGKWSVLRSEGGAFLPVRPDIGVPVIRRGTDTGNADTYYRISEPGDLQREDDPTVDFGIFQSSEAHRIIFPRPRIEQNQKMISSTQVPLLADLYSLTGSTGLFPDKSMCFSGETAYQLIVGAEGQYSLGSSGMNFIKPDDRFLFNSDAFKANLRYEQNATYKLNPDGFWSVNVPLMKIAMSLGPFSDLMSVYHKLDLSDGALAKFGEPSIEYATALSAIVDTIKFLTKLLHRDNVLEVICSAGSFNFQAALDLPIEDPDAANGYIDLPPMRIKGRLTLGLGNQPAWNGYLGISLGMEVPVLPPIYGLGEAAIMLKGSELATQEIAIQLTWGADIPINLKVIEVQGSIYYRLAVAESNGEWQIGLLVGVSGTVDLWIATITARLELMAIVETDGDTVTAIGQARFAAEIEVCWFLTIDIDYTVEYSSNDLGI